MTVVNGYCSVADVRAQMGDVDSKLDVSMIERAINASSRAVDRYCRRRFWQDTDVVVRLFAVDDPCVADVDDISTQTGLVVETDHAGQGAWSAMDAADFHLEPLNADADAGAFAWWQIVADHGSGFPVSRRPLLRVTARWGWSQVPDEVGEATVIKATSLFKRKDAPFGIAGFGDFGVVRIGRYDPDVTDLLRPFRIPVIA